MSNLKMVFEKIKVKRMSEMESQPSWIIIQDAGCGNMP